MKRMLVTLLLVALTIPVLAQEDAPAQVETQVQSVALFKNGFGFFTRVGELPDTRGEVQIGPLPPAVHGTLWLGWDEGVQFGDLRSRKVPGTATRGVYSIEDLIRANIGERVRIRLSGEGRNEVTGTIVSFSKPEAMPPRPMEASIMPPSGPGVLLLRTNNGVMAVEMHRVETVVFLNGQRTEVPTGAMHAAIVGDLREAPGGAGVSVSYLTRGITWAPSYLVDISSEDSALLTAKAVIINEVEDLANTSVELVTGFPHLEFMNVISPLAQREDLASFLNSLYSGQQEYMRREAPVMAQVARNAPMYDAAPMPDYGAPAGGVEAEDLFFYPLENVTLAYGETGYYPLFSQRVPYEHVYTWEIPDYVDEYDQYRGRDEQQRQIVWHSLRLTNETGMPWTTAPAETMQNGRILGQSTLHYSARGAETLLKITQALGIAAEELELEINREPGVENVRGTRYDRVTVRGTLTMRSHLDREVTVEVKKTLTGEVQETSPQAEVEKLAARLQQANPRSRLTWELPLPPGETVEMTYVYSVLVRG